MATQFPSDYPEDTEFADVEEDLAEEVERALQASAEGKRPAAEGSVQEEDSGGGDKVTMYEDYLVEVEEEEEGGEEEENAEVGSEGEAMEDEDRALLLLLPVVVANIPCFSAHLLWFLPPKTCDSPHGRRWMGRGGRGRGRGG